MHSPPRILIVDDNETNRDILMARLGPQGYDLKQAADGEEALAAAKEHLPDLILLDIMMPKIDGIEVCKRIKNDATMPFTPIILCTAKADSKDVVAGLEAGADEYLTKPIDQLALVARVKAALRLKQLHDQVTDMNRNLEQRVTDQLGEIERMSGLKRFLAPQIAELVLSSGGEKLLDSHRKDVTIVFCDLRGFTAFTETTEPEEAMNVLREYHAALGELIFRYEGTLDRYAGDGVMILFNAPIQFADHTRRAVKMAVEMRDTIGELTERWRNRGHSLGFGVGIALGYATLGQIGFEQRLEYAAIGSVTNLASRLCDEAKAGQIVVARRVYGMVENFVEARPIDDLHLKGFNHPVLAMEILRWREDVDNVIDATAAARRRKQ
jgi:class 3 adenylate cyclase